MGASMPAAERRRRVLVTGSSGFLGSHVADALSASGHDVVLYDLRPSPYRTEDQCEIIGDVLDLAALAAAAEGCQAIYHMAAVADIEQAIEAPLNTVNVNIVGTANVLEAAHRHGVDRMVYASTIYVYSNHGGFYRTSKRASELLIEDYREHYGLAYTILRFGSLYGPRADARNSVHDMLTQALADRRIDYFGTGEEVREYIHVYDAAAAAADILDPDFANESISLTGRERLKTRDILEMIKEIMGGGIEINCQSSSSYVGHYMQTPYNYTPSLGKKLARDTYIDLGLGLVECLKELDRANFENGGLTE